MTREVRIEALHVYPFKSCRGHTVESISIAELGFDGDRAWMAINAHGRFLSQREFPQLALVDVAREMGGLRLSAPGMSMLTLRQNECTASRTVSVWRDTFSALDAGDHAASWMSKYLSSEARIVAFDPTTRRLCSREFTGEIDAFTSFSDGYPILAIGEASLRDLNSRLQGEALPMNRFRPNIVLTGLAAYEEDAVKELHGEGIVLRVVKPCTRCKITTVDQATGVPTGDEPLSTLKQFRWDPKLNGATFGQNMIIIEGVGRALHVGDVLTATF